MATLHKVESFKLITSAEELRRIADILEAKEKSAKLGEDTCAYIIENGNTVLEFRLKPTLH